MGQARKHDWIKIKAAFMAGIHGLDKLAEELGIDYRYLRRRAGRERWHDERAKITRAAEDKAMNKLVDQRATMIAARAKEHLAIAAVFKKLALNTLMPRDAAGNALPPPEFSVHEAIRAGRAAQQIERQTLNMDDFEDPEPAAATRGTEQKPTMTAEQRQRRIAFLEEVIDAANQQSDIPAKSGIQKPGGAGSRDSRGGAGKPAAGPGKRTRKN